MARLEPGFGLQVTGKIGNYVFRKIRGRYYLGRCPESRKKPTEAQKEHRSRFRAASAYAQWVQRNPKFHAFYAPIAEARGLRVRAVAIGDWFHPPQVEGIDLGMYRGQAGDTIGVRATDDIGVVRVRVRIEGPDREQIELGEAVLEAGLWRYAAKVTLPAEKAVTIEVTAYDRPDHQARLKVNWPERV
jgi:hypothetical protein